MAKVFIHLAPRGNPFSPFGYCLGENRGHFLRCGADAVQIFREYILPLSPFNFWTVCKAMSFISHLVNIPVLLFCKGGRE